MSDKLIRIASLLLFLQFYCSCSNRVVSSGRVSVDDSRFIGAKRIALMYDIPTNDGDHIWALQSLSHALNSQGFDVIERFNISDLFKETSFDAHGITLATISDDSANVSGNATVFSPEKLKEFGKMFNVNYLGFYGYRHGEQMYLRIVESETGKIMALASFEGQTDLILTRQTIADALVDALLTSANNADKTNRKKGSYGFRIQDPTFFMNKDQSCIATDTLNVDIFPFNQTKVISIYTFNPIKK